MNGRPVRPQVEQHARVQYWLTSMAPTPPLERDLSGIIPAVITPFDASGALDVDAARTILRHLKDQGVHGFFVAGSTGEAWALDDDERVRLAGIALEVAAGEVPVFAGSGRSSTRATVALATRLAAAGVDAIVLPPPDFVRPSETELFNHFAEVAAAVGCGVVLYNIPQFAGYPLRGTLVARVAEACGNLRALKDSAGDLTQTLEFRRALPERVAVFTGADPLLLPLLLGGGQGAVLGSASIFPEVAVAVFERWRTGDFAGAREAQSRLLPFWLFARGTTFPAAYKAAAEILGLPAGAPRRPVVPLAAEPRLELERILASVGVRRLRA